LLGDADRLRVTAEAGERDHSVPFAKMRDLGADGVDDARHFVADHAGGWGRVRVESDAGHDVREVDAGGTNPDADLTGPRGGVRSLFELEDAGAAVARKYHSSHGRHLYPPLHNSTSCAQAGRAAKCSNGG